MGSNEDLEGIRGELWKIRQLLERIETQTGAIVGRYGYATRIHTEIGDAGKVLIFGFLGNWVLLGLILSRVW